MQTNHEGKWCWGPQGAEEYHGHFDTEQEAHAEARAEADAGLAEGTETQYEVAQLAHPLDLVTDGQIGRHIGNMIEAIDESAYDEVGGDDPVFKFNGADNSPVLIAQVRAFIRENATATRYGVKNVTTHTYIAGAGQQEGGAV